MAEEYVAIATGRQNKNRAGFLCSSRALRDSKWIMMMQMTSGNHNCSFS